MITTGRTVNIMLGHGDSERWNLLGGSNGDAGDVGMFGSGGGRIIPSAAADVRLRAAYASGTKPTTGGSGSGGSSSEGGGFGEEIARY